MDLKSVVLERANCPNGCGAGDKLILVGHDRLHNLPGEFSLVKCRNCGLMRTDPRPTPDTMGFYYPDNYGPYLGTQVRQQQATKSSGMKKILGFLLKRFFNFHAQSLPSMTPGRMLEIGCASGGFLHQMAARGWEVEGIEFSESAAQRAALLGYPVHVGALETAPHPQESYDLIVGWMVLEHLYDPVAGLRRLREWAKPGAWLVLSVPNAGSLEFRLFKDKWYALQLPTHIHHFTPETLREILQAGGWKLKKVYHQRVLSNLIASAGYLLKDKDYVSLGEKLVAFPENSGKWPYILYPLAWLLSAFGQTGRMTIWAEVES